MIYILSMIKRNLSKIGRYVHCQSNWKIVHVLYWLSCNYFKTAWEGTMSYAYSNNIIVLWVAQT